MISSGLISGAITAYSSYKIAKKKSETELKAIKEQYAGEINKLIEDKKSEADLYEKNTQTDMVKLVIDSILKSLPNTKRAIDMQLSNRLKDGEIDVIQMFNSKTR